MRRYRDPLVVLILILVPFVFYVSNAKGTRDHNVVDKAIVWISSPVQWVVVSALDGITSVWRRYIALVGVEEENEALRTENARLRAALAGGEEQRLENERLERLVHLREGSPEVNPIFARIIATSPTPLFRSVRIDCGTSDRIHVGAAVVSHDGVVGRVAAVSGGWADVMLLVDAASSIDVVVQRTRSRARVRGLGGDKELGIKVEYLTRTEDVAPGDILITSGVGTVFPKGLRVGKVTSIERGAFGLYQGATVEPSVDFRRIEEVMVIPRGWPRDANFEKHGRGPREADFDGDPPAPEGEGAAPVAAANRPPTGGPPAAALAAPPAKEPLPAASPEEPLPAASPEDTP